MVERPVDLINRKLSGISRPATSLLSHARGIYQGGSQTATSLTSSWELSDAEYIQELTQLKIVKECFTDEDYRFALQDYLNLEIRVEYLNDIQYPKVQQTLKSLGIQAGIVPDPRKEVLWIILPKSLKPWFKARYCLHELGHPAGYHPVPPDRVMDEEYAASRELWYPPRQLAARKPPITVGWSTAEADRWREKNADLRENLGLKFGLWGNSYWNRDEVFLGLRK